MSPAAAPDTATTRRPTVGVVLPTREALRAVYGYPLEAVSLIQACRAGTASQILADLRASWEAGARAFVLRLASLDAPERQLDACAQDVLPQIETW